MKQKFIEDLYFGRYRPFERTRTLNPARDAIEQQIDAETRYFTADMRDDDCRRFLDLSDLYTASILLTKWTPSHPACSLARGSCTPY